MGLRLVPKSVTLNGLERCTGRYFALFYYTPYVKVVEDKIDIVKGGSVCLSVSLSVTPVIHAKTV